MSRGIRLSASSQSGIGFLVNVATQDEHVIDLAVIGDLDLAGQPNHQPLPVLRHRWALAGWAAADPMSGTGARGFTSGVPVIAIPYQSGPVALQGSASGRDLSIST